MTKPDLSAHTGEQLFDYYTSIDGEYKQTLFTAHLTIGDRLFKLLEKAEKKGGKIVLVEKMNNVCDPPISVEISKAIIDGKGFDVYSPYRSKCASCIHFNCIEYTCKAFPKGIPERFLSGKAIHNTVVRGQDENVVLELQ